MQLCNNGACIHTIIDLSWKLDCGSVEVSLVEGAVYMTSELEYIIARVDNYVSLCIIISYYALLV